MQKSRKNAHLNFTIGTNEFCDYTCCYLFRIFFSVGRSCATTRVLILPTSKSLPREGTLAVLRSSAASLSCSRFFVALFVPFGCSFAAEPRVPILSFPESPPREGTLVVLLTPGWFLTGVAGVSLSFSRLVVPGRCVFFRFSLPVVAAPFIFCPGRCGFRVGYLLCRRASTVFSRAARREGM